MVHRNKPTTAPPELTHHKWDQLRLDMIREGNAHKEVKACYRDTILEDLQKIYKNKCAICERRRGQELEVDHYRPKKARATRMNPEFNQPGYYWLCYEWSNLIPLCSKCNNNKSNKFPLSGWSEMNRITSHLHATLNVIDATSLNSHELPLIINPEIEKNPEKHFLFTKDGFIHHRTEEGKVTIEVCKLNRKDLRRKRLKYIKKYRKSISEAFAYFSEHENEEILHGELIALFRGLKDRCKKKAVFSLFHVFLYRYFDYYIGSGFPTEMRDKVCHYFTAFKTINN